uniref:Uncharacterized protein n=1 Tax=Pyrodinium bahamense TaxID=73915 RepID=A0A7R9ZV34_9DINO|mmetsp:Transcript_10474/g.29118  ORF Transcript_10474/g.29118 Transcript_10474/m.29118 type:complete len:167 (+) Transcript_10474:83-583(+)
MPLHSLLHTVSLHAPEDGTGADFWSCGGRNQAAAPWLHSARRGDLLDLGAKFPTVWTLPGRHCQGVAATVSSFEAVYSRATQQLKDGSKFLADITGSRGWDYTSKLLRDPVVVQKFGHEYDDLARNAEDARSDLARAKQLLQNAVYANEDEEEAGGEEAGGQEAAA